MKHFDPLNALHIKLAKTLPHVTIGAVFSDCILVGVHLYFKTQEALEVAERFRGQVKQAMPNLIMQVGTPRS